MSKVSVSKLSLSKQDSKSTGSSSNSSCGSSKSNSEKSKKEVEKRSSEKVQRGFFIYRDSKLKMFYTTIKSKSQSLTDIIDVGGLPSAAMNAGSCSLIRPSFSGS